jgi:hypothetical protein
MKTPLEQFEAFEAKATPGPWFAAYAGIYTKHAHIVEEGPNVCQFGKTRTPLFVPLGWDNGLLEVSHGQDRTQGSY